MAGWDLSSGELKEEYASEDKLWSLFNFVFSDGSRKRNTYKFGLIKSILDNIFEAICVDARYYLSYGDIFSRFAENYWNLIVKYDLRQMRRDGKSEYSRIEVIFKEVVKENQTLSILEFESIDLALKTKLIKKVEKDCKRNVIGALYEDFQGYVYGFDLKSDGIYIGGAAYEFMVKHKSELERLNYYSWARFLEKVNADHVLVRVIDKLELSTPHRNDLSIYREILRKEFEENTCFYCGKKLTQMIHVDHFIPWSFVKTDKLWNFVLSCPTCNTRKNNKVVQEAYVSKIVQRNKIAYSLDNQMILEEFKNYNDDTILRMWNYAIRSGIGRCCL